MKGRQSGQERWQWPFIWLVCSANNMFVFCYSNPVKPGGGVSDTDVKGGDLYPH